MKKLSKKFIKIILVCLFLIIIILNIKINNNVVTFFGYTRLNVLTGSMSPTINAGDMIIVKRSKEYVVNDIITFKEDESIITHRIVDIKDNSFITKGDFNNKNDDNSVNYNQIIGKVIYTIPSYGKKSNILSNPIILISIFVIGIIIVIFIPTKKTNKNN